jgi:glyoxylase-like metal-dependent hydrolase (beta-lactamase superfamily II)
MLRLQRYWVVEYHRSGPWLEEESTPLWSECLHDFLAVCNDNKRLKADIECQSNVRLLELRMKPKLLTKEVGPYSMNTYVVIDEESKTSAIIDPGGDPDVILEMTANTRVEKILLTHGHADHVMVLDEIKTATQAPVYIHPADAKTFDLSYDAPLVDGEEVTVGKLSIRILHVPGHTPGQCCLDLGDGRIIVGDTIFVGGPGRTGSPKDFATTMENMQRLVFNWPDETEFFPGHGPSGIIGQEKPAFKAFLKRGWPPETHGDVTWE